MAERFDELLRAVADRADAGVDYAAMHASILKKADAKKRALRANVLRYGSVAAALVLLLGAGLSIWGRASLMGKSAAPQEREGILTESSRGTEDVDMYSGAQEDPANGAPESGMGGMPAATSDEGITPPPGCTLGSCGDNYLIWNEGGLALPAVDFGKSAKVESDEAQFLCTVTGATEEDYEAYVTLTREMYPDSVRSDDATDSCKLYSVSAELQEGKYFLTVSLADGEMTIYVSFANSEE